jgi:hypothetical protein
MQYSIFLPGTLASQHNCQLRHDNRHNNNSVRAQTSVDSFLYKDKRTIIYAILPENEQLSMER